MACGPNGHLVVADSRWLEALRLSRDDEDADGLCAEGATQTSHGQATARLDNVGLRQLGNPVLRQTEPVRKHLVIVLANVSCCMAHFHAIDSEPGHYI